MRIPPTAWFLAGLLATSSLPASAQEADLEPMTFVTVESSYDETGRLTRNVTARETWRSDGAHARESIVRVEGRDTPNVSVQIFDVAAGRRIDAFPDLGVMMVESASERYAPARGREACLERVRYRGEPAGDDVFHRREIRNGRTHETRYDPAAGCEPVEHRVLAGDRVEYEKKLVRRIPGTDETLFQINPALEAVTRIEWAEAWRAHYGRPVSSSPEFLARLRQFDQRRPLLGLDD